MLHALTKILREEHVINKVQKAYSTISYDDFKTMLGMQSTPNDQVKSFLESRGMKISGNFVYPPSEDADRKRFELTEARMDDLSKIV